MPAFLDTVGVSNFRVIVVEQVCGIQSKRRTRHARAHTNLGLLALVCA